MLWGQRPGVPQEGNQAIASLSLHTCVPRSHPSLVIREVPSPLSHRASPPHVPLQSRASHAAAGWDLAAVPEPGHLWPWEAGDAWGADDSCFSVGDTLVLLAFLKAPHVCGREEHTWGSDCLLLGWEWWRQDDCGGKEATGLRPPT